jgi:glucokinase
MVMLTLGTGVGGGVISDGELLHGALENAGEIGHMIVVPDGRPCPCGQRGCLERYASANAVAERLVEALQAGEDSMLKARVDSGESITSVDVAQAARTGDSLAARIWDETCHYLAIAAVNMQHVLNPERFVLAGGLIGAGDQLLDPVRQHFRRQTWHLTRDYPHIELATLGDDAGIIGAAALAWREQRKESPH